MSVLNFSSYSFCTFVKFIPTYLIFFVSMVNMCNHFFLFIIGVYEGIDFHVNFISCYFSKLFYCWI